MKVLKFVIILSFLALQMLDANEDESEERSLSRQKRGLLFPQYTVLQISLCLVAQVSSIPSHRVAINSGFQINYALPFNLQGFINPIFWARAFSNESSPLLDFFERLIKSGGNGNESEDDEVDEDSDEEVDEDSNDEAATQDYEDDDTTTTEVYPTTTEKLKQKKRKPKMKRSSDLTAGQFYSGIKETLAYSGYHEDCLLKSVCELAQHPLHDDDDNVVHDVLNFVLTPSLHQGFHPETEIRERNLFEQAEQVGKLGEDCELLYGSNCKFSPLHSISHFIEATNEI